MDGYECGLLSTDAKADRRVVGTMGGHQLERDAALYRQVARLAQRLIRTDFFVATDGARCCENRLTLTDDVGIAVSRVEAHAPI